MANRTIRTSKKEGKFLAALAETGNVTKACGIAKIGRMTVYDWRDGDEYFTTRWEKALDKGADALEDEATRRAHDGVEEPVYFKGEVVGHVQKYSDTLLIFLLKGRRPEKYKDRFEHSGKAGDPLRIEHSSREIDLSGLSEKELAVLDGLLEKAAQSSG